MFLWMVLALIVCVAVAVAPAPRNVWDKLKTYGRGIKYMIVSKDLPKKFDGTNYLRISGAPNNAAAGKKRVLRIVFIRHGQSVWNSLFNAFGLMWPYRLLRAFVVETLLWFTNPLDSLIIDTPLSEKGKKEAEELKDFVLSSKGRNSIRNDTSKSVVVCSNLRRAMETAIIGLQPRLSVTRERIVIDSSLQEGSRNIDAQSFSTEKGKIANTPVHNLDTALLLHATFDPQFNAGNKTTKSNVFSRMDDFMTHLFSLNSGLLPAASSASSNAELEEVIVVGHSGWFLSFFKRFLPQGSDHVAKKKKMKNCAAVSFNLVRDEGSNEIYIDEASLEVLYRGF